MSEALYDALNHAHFVEGRKLNDCGACIMTFLNTMRAWNVPAAPE